VKRASQALRARRDLKELLGYRVLKELLGYRVLKVLLDRLALRPRLVPMKAPFGLRVPTARRQLAEGSATRTKYLWRRIVARAEVLSL
jgi:hypothetical protein